MTHSNQQSTYYDMSNSKDIKRPIEGIENSNRTPGNLPKQSSSSEELEKLIRDFFNDDLLLVCGRVWEAWQVGTMTQDDFTRIDEDEFVLPELLEKLSSFIQANYLSRAEVERVIEQSRVLLWSKQKYSDGQGALIDMAAEIRQALGLDTKKKGE